MLQSFVGTFDGTGLRTLRSEDGPAAPWYLPETGWLEFWVIVDSDAVPYIEQALMLGYRDMALQLLIRTSKSFGRVNS